MTACVNKNYKRRAAGVVTASLVGALTLGGVSLAVATPALAAEASLQSVEGTTAFAQGVVTLDGLQDGKVELAKANKVKATEVTPRGGSEIALAGNAAYTQAVYKADAQGNATGDALSEITEPGAYVVVVTAKSGDYAGSSAKGAFTVKAESLAGAVSYLVNPDNANDVSDVTHGTWGYNYTGYDLQFGFQISNAKLVEGEDYSVKYFKANTDATVASNAVTPKDAGSYVAVLTGMGDYAGETKQVTIKVEAFNLADKNTHVVVDDVTTGSTPKVSRVYWVDNTAGHTKREIDLDPSLVKLEQVDGKVFLDNDSYTFKAVKATSTDANIKNEKSSIKVNKVAALASVEYAGSALSDMTLDESKSQAWNADSLKVLDAKGNTVESNNYTVKYEKKTDSGWADATVHGLKAAGTYRVTVTTSASGTGYALGGTTTAVVTVINGTVDADAQVYVNKGGKVLASDTVTYGTSFTSSTYAVNAYDKKGFELTDAGLKVALYDADGKVVDLSSAKMLDAGTYVLKVTSDSYALTGTTEVTVTVKPYDLTQISSDEVKDWSGDAYMVTPAQELALKNIGLKVKTGTDKDGKDTYAFLDKTPDFTNSIEKSLQVWDAEKGEWADATGVAKAGTYRVGAQLKKASADGNYVFAEEDANATWVTFTVVDQAPSFKDVKPSAWYYNAIAKAANGKDAFVNGYTGGVFKPEASITRAEVVSVLFKMAGGSKGADGLDELQYDTTKGYETGFSDVDGTMWYGQAIAWAHKLGVVNGSNGEFRPSDEVSSEEFAAMLRNYAKVVDAKDVAAKDAKGTLAKMSDGSEVSGWATDAVAWAVENKVLGNAGFVDAHSDIARARVVAMAVNYLKL